MKSTPYPDLNAANCIRKRSAREIELAKTPERSPPPDGGPGVQGEPPKGARGGGTPSLQ